MQVKSCLRMRCSKVLNEEGVDAIGRHFVQQLEEELFFGIGVILVDRQESGTFPTSMHWLKSVVRMGDISGAQVLRKDEGRLSGPHELGSSIRWAESTEEESKESTVSELISTGREGTEGEAEPLCTKELLRVSRSGKDIGLVL